MRRTSIVAGRSATTGVRDDASTRGFGAKDGRSISSAATRAGERHPDDRSHDDRTFATAIGYLRVSTDAQAESGLGLEAQRASVTAAASRLGLVLRDVFVDAAVSGTLGIAQRPVLVQAIGALRRGDVLLVAKRDRLARDVFELATIERLVCKHGARIVSAAGEGTEDEEPPSVLMRRVIDSFAEYERRVIAARTKSALAAKRARGERIGTVPFGSQLAADRVHLEPAPVEERIAASVHAWRHEAYSMREIAALLNADGMTTRRGTPWRFQYVARMLRRAERSA